LDQRLAKRDIQLIAPRRGNRIRPASQMVGSKVERLFAWLHNFPRLVTRYEHHADNYLAFVHLVCIPIMLRTGFCDDF
jgi:hypothetical protein